MIQRSVLSPIDGHWTDLTGMNNKWKSYNWYFSNGHLFKIEFFSCSLWKWPQRMFFSTGWPSESAQVRWGFASSSETSPHDTCSTTRPILYNHPGQEANIAPWPLIWRKRREFWLFFCKKTFSQHNWQRNHSVSRSKSKNFAVVSFRFIFRRRILLLQINSLTL